MDTQRSLISNLTPIRGIAALLVVVFHFEILLVIFLPPSTSLFFRKCYLMVDLFFVMSGFIIAHVYGFSFKKQIPGTSMGKYMRSRFARIYPLHVVALIATVILVRLVDPHLPGVNDPYAIPTHLMMLQAFGIHKIYTWNVPAWSISAEFFAYLLFPFINFLLFRFRRFLTLFLIAGIAVSYYILIYHLGNDHDHLGPYNLDITYDFGWLRGIAGFYTGVLLYRLYETRSLYFLRHDLSFVILTILMFATLHYGWPDYFSIPLFGFIVLSAAYNTSSLKRIFDTKHFQFIGDVSYSIYLLQLPLTYVILYVLSMIGINYAGPYTYHLPYWQSLICCLAFLALLIWLSAITYRYIEKPLRNYINSLPARSA